MNSLDVIINDPLVVMGKVLKSEINEDHYFPSFGYVVGLMAQEYHLNV